MRVNKNEDVIRAWKNGQWAMTGNLSTDGSSLFSYKLRIGQTIIKENHSVSRPTTADKIVFDYTAGTHGIRYYSQTTSHHVGMAKPYAHIVINNLNKNVVELDRANIHGVARIGAVADAILRSNYQNQPA